MSTENSSSTSRIARSLAPRRVLPVALLFLIADLALTEALLGLAVEKNPIAAWPFESIGITTTGIVAVAVVTLAYVGLDALDRNDRERRVVSVGLLGAMVAPVVWNFGVWVRLGMADVLIVGVGETLAPVAVAAALALVSVNTDLSGVPRPSRDAVASITLSVLMMTSMVGGVAFVGTQPMGDASGDGIVKAQSEESDVVYTGGNENVVRAINTSSQSEIWSASGHSNTIEDVSQSADGDLVFSGASDDTVKAWNATTGENVWTYNGHSGTITSISASPTGGVVYSGSYDNTVKAIDTSSGEEIWSFNGHSDSVISTAISPDGGVVYSGSFDHTIRAINTSNGEEMWSFDNNGDGISLAASPDGKFVAAGSEEGDNRLNVLTSSGNQSWTKSFSSQFSIPESVAFSPDSSKVFAGVNNNINAYDSESGEQIWSNTNHSGSVYALSPKASGGVLYSGALDNTLRATDTTTGENIWTYNGYSDSIRGVAAGGLTGSSSGGSTPFSGWENTAPLIRAVDQNGDPVPDAEIEAWSVQSENLEAEAENKSERAEEILDQLEDVQPDDWTPPAQADLTYGDLTDLYNGEQPSGLYPTAHTKGDMGIAGWADTHDLQPRLEYESGETIYLYAWDGSAGANMGPTDDGVTSEHYGEIADDPTFTLKRLSANGEVLDNHTVSTTQSETYSGGIPPLSYDHDYATAEVPDGYYRVSVQGSDTPGYVIKVGEATDVLTTELRNEANQLTEQSEFLQDYLTGDSLARDSVTANKMLYKYDHTDSGPPVDTSKFDYGDGYVNPGLSPSGTDPTDMEANRVENFPSVAGTEIFLQGYKGPGFGVGDYGTNDTSDILEMAQDVDEPIYVSKKPKRVDMSEIDDPRNTTIEVELTKLDTGLNPNVSEYANETERLRNELLNQTTAELESLFRDNPELLNKTDLETRHEELDELIESNNDLEERVAELRDAESVEDAANASEEQLRNDLAAMEQAIAELEGQLEAEDPTSEIDNGEIFAEFPFAESLDPEAVTVIANYEDGSSEVVPDEYISVESASVLGGDQVVVDGLEIANDRAVADLEVKGVSTEGALGTSRDSITNPSFQGAIPELDAIDVSTLRPGVGDSVSVEPRSSAEGYGGAESATVYGPDGDTLNVTQNDERFTWSPEQTGTHTVRVTYTNRIGGQFTETFRLKAEENPPSNPPTVRITDGIGGNLVLAGSGLESGSISVDGAEAEVVAQAPGDQSPSSLDIRAQQLAVDSMDVSVVQGADQRSVDRHVSLRVWANFGVEDALVLRQSGEPITANEETPYGAFQTRTSESGAEHQVVETYTEADGTTTVQVQRNPSLLDRASYQIAIWGIDLPFTYLPTTPDSTLPLTMLHPIAVDEATPGEVVFGPADMTAAATGVGA